MHFVVLFNPTGFARDNYDQFAVLCGPGGPVVLLPEGRLGKLREELVEAIQ